MLAEIESTVEQEARERPAGPVDVRPIPRASTATRDHKPPRPSGLVVDAWSPRVHHLEVAGEWYRASNLRRLLNKHAQLSPSGVEMRLPAVLVPDPANPHDSYAVAVFVDNLHIGYMERADAARYHATLACLAPANLAVPSRQWVRATGSDTWARVTLSIPEPTGLSHRTSRERSHPPGRLGDPGDPRGRTS